LAGGGRGAQGAVVGAGRADVVDAVGVEGTRAGELAGVAVEELGGRKRRPACRACSLRGDAGEAGRQAGNTLLQD
jgi:hypothetical protein